MGSSEGEAAFAAASAGGSGGDGRQGSGGAQVKRVRLSDLYSDSRVATELLQPQVDDLSSLHSVCVTASLRRHACYAYDELHHVTCMARVSNSASTPAHQ